jgi:cell division protein FtsB
MNPFEMVVLIVAIVMFAGVFKSRYSHRRRGLDDQEPAERLENQRLREEVSELKERIKVLERITVEKENSLAKQIEELRDQ